MHRFYGTVIIDGKPYRVMTLMREEKNPIVGNGIHAYEVQKIEVLDEETPNTSNGVGTPAIKREAYPLAKVIKDVGKTMEKDKKLLDESKIADESTDLYRDPNEVEDILNDQSLGSQERITATAADVEQGLYLSQGKMSAPTTEGTDAPQEKVCFCLSPCDGCNPTGG